MGFLEGRATVLVQVLEMRGIVMGAADRNFILACADIDTLNTWRRRVWQISRISELFED